MEDRTRYFMTHFLVVLLNFLSESPGYLRLMLYDLLLFFSVFNYSLGLLPLHFHQERILIKLLILINFKSILGEVWNFNMDLFLTPVHSDQHAIFLSARSLHWINIPESFSLGEGKSGHTRLVKLFSNSWFTWELIRINLDFPLSQKHNLAQRSLKLG